MALAVAMVACSGAAGTPGPAGPPGESGAPGTPAEPGDPTTTPGGPVPVQVIKATATIVFNDDDKGKASTASEDVMLAEYFYPSTGLEFMFDGDPPKMVNASIMDGVLTVGIKSDADHMTHMVKVKASNEIDSETITFNVRRNRRPMIAMHAADADSDAVAKTHIYIWVGSKAKELKIVDLAKDATCIADEMDCIPISLMWGHAVLGNAGEFHEDQRAFFYDDAGNSLNLVPEALSTTNRGMLDVMGGDMVTLMGLGSTWKLADTSSPMATDEKSIVVDFTAQDDNGLSSLNTPVLKVMVDTAPSRKGAIGTRVIKASGDDAARQVKVSDVGAYFKDDRLGKNSLTYYAWSSDPDVVLVEGNEDNVSKVHDDSRVDILDSTGNPSQGDAVTSDIHPITIIAVNPGEAMITVMVVEPDAKDTGVDAIAPGDGVIAHGALGQSVDHTFKVVVQLN